MGGRGPGADVGPTGVPCSEAPHEEQKDAPAITGVPQRGQVPAVIRRGWGTGYMSSCKGATGESVSDAGQRPGRWGHLNQ